jgi:tripartite-type tricarboxylate transporter receptor subunit TctC
MQMEVAKAMQAQSIIDGWAQQGAALGGNPPAEFAVYVKSEIAKWGDVAKKSGARID